MKRGRAGGSESASHSSQEPERTADGRYIVVDGRKWRASDPAIPDALRAQLVGELMDARRAIHRDRDNPERVAHHRRRVQDAKVALGERGQPWWEAPSVPKRRERIAATLRTMLRRRGLDKTVCPSDIARIVASPEWRPLMDEVRSVALELHEQQMLEVTQKGEVVAPRRARGAIRYRATEALLAAAGGGES